MPKKRKPPETFDEHLASVVASRMQKRGATQEQVAAAADVPLSNFGRRMRGLVPFTAAEVVRVAGYLKFDPADIVQEAVDDFGGTARLLSEAADTSRSTNTKRKQNEVLTLTSEQLENRNEVDLAAENDPEERTDETDAP